MDLRSPRKRRSRRAPRARRRRRGLRVRWLADSGTGNSDHREFGLAGYTAAKLGVVDNPRRPTAARRRAQPAERDLPARAAAIARAAPDSAYLDMPEGDTIHYAANRIRPILAGRVPELRTPHPRFGATAGPSAWPAARSTAVDAHGKHLFLHFEGDLVIHSHLRMTGSWGVLAPASAGGARRGAPGSCCAPRDREVVQFDGPVLELMTDSRTRFDQRIAGLGPDIIAPELRRGALPAPPARGRPDAADRRRAAGPADVAGIGNLWKVEGCLAAEIDPWRPAGEVSDDEALAIVARARPRMQQSALDGMQTRSAWSTARRAARARAAGRASPSAASGRTTARRTGARDASAEARRPQGRRPPRPREHAAPVRGRDGRRRRHDRVRRAARASVDGTGALYLAHDYAALRPARR